MRMRIYHFVASINTSSIADKIAKQVQYALRTLKDAFKRVLALEAGQQLAESVHFGRSPQVMQVSSSSPCYHDSLKACVHQVNARDSQEKCNACWKCGGLGHFQKDCQVNPNPQGGDRDDATLSDTNPAIRYMSHTLTASMPITNLTFKAILKELVSSAIGSRKAFHLKTQNTLKPSS